MSVVLNQTYSGSCVNSITREGRCSRRLHLQLSSAPESADSARVARTRDEGNFLRRVAAYKNDKAQVRALLRATPSLRLMRGSPHAHLHGRQADANGGE
jgi:hypothetical protein